MTPRGDEPTRVEATVLSDLSANVFAALLLVLLILMQSAAQTDPGVAAQVGDRTTIEATRAGGSSVRAPMAAGDIIAFLRDRRPEAAGLSLDLTDAGVAAAGEGAAEPGAGEASPAALDRLLERGDAALPVRLYVFSHRHYARVAARLAAAGRGWREISVPGALTGPSGGWSPAFLALLTGDPGPRLFRDGLARLLDAAPERRTRPGAAGLAAGPTGGPAGGLGRTPRSLWDGLLAALRTAVAVLAVIAGVGTVAAVEILVPRGPRRYGPAWVVHDRRRFARE